MTLPATDGILEKLQALLAYDASSPLIFSSGLFLFLFAGFMLIYNAFRRAPMARIVYVILFSLYFYYKSSGIYFLLLIFAATSDFLIAQGIYRVRSRAAKRWLVVLSVMVNLGMLGYFKYTNFLVDIANQMFGQGFLQFQNIFLPVGISFFVFQSMSYTIDIYRGQLKPLGNWCDYLFYLSFFPQLVAGPIVRARDFIPQIRRNPVVVTREMFGTGVFLILTGLFKKAIISDYISLNFVDRIFDEPLLYSGFECLAGIYGYALQIYCDFSGYSDMAIGIALLLGFRFPKNFDAPYKSATITEFWRRWHISLSSWLRDYLYISLGGNRKGKLRTYGNLIPREQLEAYTELMHHPERIDDFCKSDDDFHELLMSSLPNKYLRSGYDRITGLNTRFRIMTGKVSMINQEQTCEEHLEILNAALSDNWNTAADALQHHLELARDKAEGVIKVIRLW